jgi:hypothetical protein
VLDAPSKAAALINAIEDDNTGASGELAWKDPELVVETIADWFEGEGIEPPSSASVYLRDPWVTD